ncbi:GntR family transcriptional regulator [Promicromonospora sp. NFX87]|uniref:GntR family transcriptional regulator n=1 Tax=Promicromonospora sp. NFX87 TaxID=3402691 RepID=UPI003AFB413F
MSALDPDDPRPPYQQVAAALRAAILTRTIAPGDKLPSQKELGEHYGVARMTVQQALRILKDDGLVTSRQGSGMYARERTERPVGLRPHLEMAFEADDVRIDVVGYTAETLHGAIAEPLDKIRTGRLTPQSIHIRLLMSDMSKPLALPAAVSGDDDDNAGTRQRMADIGHRHINAVRDSVLELADLELVPTVTVEARSFGSAPVFKAYVINGTLVFFGFYPVVTHDVRVNGEKVSIYDPMGKDAVLFHYTDDGDPESIESTFVVQVRQWFDSVWNSVATEVAP